MRGSFTRAWITYAAGFVCLELIAAAMPQAESRLENLADFRPHAPPTDPTDGQSVVRLIRAFPLKTPDANPSTPTLSAIREGNRLRITFTGTLLFASTPLGPWSPVPNATSPYLFAPDGPSLQFFRTMGEEPDPDDLFGSRSVIQWTLTGPFQSHFDLAFAGLPDGIFPPHREKPYFDGNVRLTTLDIPGEIRVRGNSSLQECPFPKLKLKVSREDRVGTPFASAREVKIGTHCADGGSGTVGRLRDQIATYREALAYEVVEILGFVGPKVRRARILYQDTSEATEHASSVGWTVERQAVLLEDIEVVGERLGGRALDDEEVSALKDANFDPQLVANLRLVQVLFGNWDFALSETGEGLWNFDVISLPGVGYVPVTGDFDLSSWVTGNVRLNAPPDFRPDLPDLERETAFQMGETKKRIGAAAFAQGRDLFLSRRPEIEEQIRTAEMDESGRTNAKRHLDAFFAALLSQ